MELVPFTVKSRTTSGKGPARRARVAEEIPGIVYGPGTDNVSIVADKKTFDHLIHDSQGEHSLVPHCSRTT